MHECTAPVSLAGETATAGRDSVLIEYGTSGERASGVSDEGFPDLYTLRTRKWRLSYYPHQEYGELYDLEDDPNEFVNRWRDPRCAEARTRLELELLDRLLGAHDPLPVRERLYWCPVLPNS